MQLPNVGSGPRGQNELGRFSRPERADLTLLGVLFDKERDRHVVRFNEKLTGHQPVTNIEQLDLSQVMPDVISWTSAFLWISPFPKSTHWGALLSFQ
jgi:hypothetical protein